MARLDIERRTVHDRAHSESVDHKHVPGRAYEVSNPVEKLIHIIGGGFFNEPKYYDTNRSSAAFQAELRANGCISSVIKDEMGLSEQAQEVIETAHAVAEGDYEGADPRDLLVVAAWARDTQDGLKLRTTPQILYTIAASHERTRPYIHLYGTDIMKRPDEVCQVFAGYRHLFQKGEGGRHKGSLPHRLRRGMERALANFNNYQIIKYSAKQPRPNLADVLKMLNGRSDYPLSKGLFNYVVNDKIDENSPDMLRARKEFFELEDFEGVTPQLIERANLTWENVLSKFGEKGNPKPEVWETIIPYMGETALLKNLRNFEQAGISRASWDQVTEKLLSAEKTKQLPFNFLAANNAVTSTEAKTIVGLKLDQACENIPDLPGETVIFTDNSGSATGCAVSGKSTMRVSDAGNVLQAIAAKKLGSRAHLGVFGDSFMWVPFSQADSCMSIKEKIDRYALKDERSTHNALAATGHWSRFERGPGVGGSTETGLWFGIDDITRRRVKVDRIVLLSDLCCYTQGDINCGVNMSEYFGRNATVQSMIDKYRQQVNPDVKVYSINLAGYEQAQTQSDKNSHLLSGWSENIFKVIRQLEDGDPEQGGQGEQQEDVNLPTLEALRAKYQKEE
jgi:hypothetical protein